jgi:hypothetical protein
MTINASLKVRIRKTIDLFSLAHLLSFSIDEMMTSLEKEKIKLQDYVFTQRFSLMMKFYDKKRQRLVMKCSRHKKKTRNTRKIKKKDKKKTATNVVFNDCRYRVRWLSERKKRKKINDKSLYWKMNIITRWRSILSSSQSTKIAILIARRRCNWSLIYEAHSSNTNKRSV